MTSSERNGVEEKDLIPAVSVIIPVFNSADYLRECLDSAAAQTLRDIEILCVNDGSTDALPEILREYAARDGRFRILDRENGGISEARNTGVREAAGRYLFFLDSDDVLIPDALKRCADRMDRLGLEYLCFNAVAFGEGTECAKRAGVLNRNYFRRTLDDQALFSGPELLEDLRNTRRYISPVWSCMISRRSFLEYGLWFRPGILHEDELWTFTVLTRVSRAGCLNRVLYRYRIRTGSVTNSGGSFAEVYSGFICALEMERMLPGTGNAGEAGRMNVVRMLRRAIREYSGLSEEERNERKGLPPEESLLFDMAVDYPAQLIRDADAECEKLKRKIGELKSDRYYRLSRAVTKPYRILRSVLTKDRRKPVKTRAAADPAAGGGTQKIAWLLGTPAHNNLGDHCITREEIRFLMEVMPDHAVTEVTDRELKGNVGGICARIAPGQPVFLHGGGNLGTLWPELETLRESILRRLRRRQVVILPQSILFDDSDRGRKALVRAKAAYRGKNVVLCCRDAVSYAFAEEHFGCRTLLVPDMVMWEARKTKGEVGRFGAVTLLRSDRERVLTDADRTRIEDLLAARFGSVEVADTIVTGRSIGPQNREEAIDGLIGMLFSAECVVTDRLHGMLLCAVTGTPCIAMKNGYHKVEACHEWIADLGYIRFIRDIGELASAIEAVLFCGEKEYPQERMRERFVPLIRQAVSMEH